MKNLKSLACKNSLPGIAIVIIMFICFIQNIKSQTSMFGTNPQHTSHYNSIFQSDLILSKKWAYKTKGPIFSSAAIVNDVVFFGSDDSCFYAVTADGSLKWKFVSNGKIRSTPAVKDTVVYFNNYGGVFYALDTRNGNEIWRFTTDGEMARAELNLNGYTPAGQVYVDLWDFYLSSPVFVDSIIYFGSGTNVYAINLKTRTQLWKYPTPKIVHSSPAVYDGIIYFGCYDGKLYALDAHTGNEIWKYQTGTDDSRHSMEGIQSSPTVVDTIVYFGSRDANAYALNAKTGKIIWSFYAGGSWMPSSFAVYNDTIYTGSSDAANFYAFDRFNGINKYSINTHNLNFSTPAIADGYAFMGCLNGSLFVFDLSTRKIKCRFDTDGRKADVLNVVLEDGSRNTDVIRYTSAAYDESVEMNRRLRTAGSILSSPVIDKNVIFFGSTDSCFYAVCDSASY